MNNFQQQIMLDSMSIPIGVTTRDITCPFCAARNDVEQQSFVVTRLEQGLFYKCFRVKCDTAGFIATTMNELLPTGNIRVKPAKIFTRPLSPLPTPIITWIKDKYNIDIETLRRNHVRYDFSVNYLHFPLYTYHGNCYGSSIKKLPEQFLNKETDIRYWEEQNKSIHYIEDHTRPLLYFPLLGNDPISHQTLVVVEDILSALRISKFNDCVALLGTALDDNKIKELKRYTDSITLALDPDAVAKALWYERKYKLFFQEFKRAVLKMDAKDYINETDLKRDLLL